MDEGRSQKIPERCYSVEIEGTQWKIKLQSYEILVPIYIQLHARKGIPHNTSNTQATKYKCYCPWALFQWYWPAHGDEPYQSKGLKFFYNWQNKRRICQNYSFGLQLKRPRSRIECKDKLKFNSINSQLRQEPTISLRNWILPKHEFSPLMVTVSIKTSFWLRISLIRKKQCAHLGTNSKLLKQDVLINFGRETSG